MGRRNQDEGGCCLFNCFGCLIFIVVLVAVCGVGYALIIDNAPEFPIADYQPNQAQSQTVENKIDEARQQAEQSGRFVFNITEAEASSWLNLDAVENAGVNTPFDAVMVRFNDGNASVFGLIDAFGVTDVVAEAVFELGITEDGQVMVELGNVNFSGIGMPGVIKNELNEQIQGLMDERIRNITDNAPYRLDRLQLEEGFLTVEATAR